MNFHTDSLPVSNTNKTEIRCFQVQQTVRKNPFSKTKPTAVFLRCDTRHHASIEAQSRTFWLKLEQLKTHSLLWIKWAANNTNPSKRYPSFWEMLRELAWLPYNPWAVIGGKLTAILKSKSTMCIKLQILPLWIS